MAGKPGRSGGARLGAGRPRNPPVLLDFGRHDTPQSFLLALMNAGDVDLKLRINAAKALMPFVHRKPGEASKKVQQADAAKRAAAGRFAAAEPPKLTSVK